MSNTPTAPTPPTARPSLAKRVRLPRLSGKASAAWLVACFVLTGVLIPMALGLPRWVAFEVVIAVWWAVWLGVLAWLLFTGQRVSDDHQLHEPRNWFSFGSDGPRRVTGGSDWWDGFFWGWLLADDAILIILGLFLLLGVVWFVFEIAVPVVLFLLYFVARGMLARVVNDHHHCRGRAGRALAWAFVWATVYTAPLAGAVWFVHAVHNLKAGA